MNERDEFYLIKMHNNDSNNIDISTIIHCVIIFNRRTGKLSQLNQFEHQSMDLSFKAY